MRIIGCDFHSRYQQIAMLETETGEVVERRLEHENGEARSFYARLPQPVRVRIEATGYTQWFKRLLQELERLPLDRWASRRRRELPELYDRLNQPIAELDQAVRQEAYGNASAVRLMTHPGVGPLTSLTFVLTMGPASRFARGKKVASYLVLNPREDSSGGHRRTGAIRKQGISLLRWLLVEAGQTAARRDPELHCLYQRVKYRRGSQIAKVAVARKLTVRLYWMLRNQRDYAPGKSAAVPMPDSSSSAVMTSSASGR